MKARNATLDDDTYDNFKDGYRSVKNLLCAFASLETAARMVEQHALDNELCYDAILVLRPDTAIIKDIDLPENLAEIRSGKRVLWVPDMHHWGGYNDRMAFGETDVMLKDYMRRGAAYRDWEFGGDPMNGEKHLKLVMERASVTVRFSKARLIRVRAGGIVQRLDSTPSNLNLPDSDADFARCVRGNVEARVTAEGKEFQANDC